MMFLSWLRRILYWILSAKYSGFMLLFGALFFASLTFYSCVFILQNEQSVRFGGLTLQFLGLMSAGLGVRDTRKMFGRPGFLKSIGVWLKAFPSLRPKTVSGSAEGRFAISAGGKGWVWANAGVDSSVESRLKALEDNIEELRARIKSNEAEFLKDVQSLTREIEGQSALRATENQEIHSKIESVSADGLNLAAGGLILLAFGVAMSTIPTELILLIG